MIEDAIGLRSFGIEHHMMNNGFPFAPFLFVASPNTVEIVELYSWKDFAIDFNLPMIAISCMHSVCRVLMLSAIQTGYDVQE